MLTRILTTALAAGILAGVLISAVQAFTTLPLIKQAETFENAAAAPTYRIVPTTFVLAHDSSGEPKGGHAHPTVETEAWSPEEGLERFLYTATANVLTGVGYALILVACFVFAGRRVDGQAGLLWGIAGYAVFTLAPTLGLPPELPATAAGDLVARQAWWFLAVGCTATGLWLMFFRPATWAKALGVAVLFVPHLIGAPHPGELTKAVPPELAAHFSAASIVVSAMFWALLGWLAGTVFERMSRTISESAEAAA